MVVVVGREEGRENGVEVGHENVVDAVCFRKRAVREDGGDREKGEEGRERERE